MSKREILVGSTDQTIDVFVQDSSVSTGDGLTGLVYNTSNLVCYYRKGATGTPTALTLATQTVGGAHSDGGFVAVDGTNCPGQYRLDLSDTIVAALGMVTIYLKGAANMAPCVTEIEVVAVNKFDAMRGGMTALPDAAAGAIGGVPLAVDASGRVDILKINGTSQTPRDIGESVLISAGTGAGQLDITNGVVLARDHEGDEIAKAMNLATLISRVGSFTATGVNTVLGMFKALLSKTATLPSDVGGTFDPATDSTEAVSEAVALTATQTKLLKYVRLLARKDAATATDQATELTEINANAGSGAGGYANTTNSLESGFEASINLPTVDGMPFEDAVAAILGAVVGVRNVSDNTITFYGRDGTTLLGTLTIGDVAGVIETSVLTAD